MPADPLRLEVAEFADIDRWRWVLQERGGAFVADHTVALDRDDPRHAALLDLPGYLHRYAAPDTRKADERRLIGEVGAWVGERVLGPGIMGKLLARAKPAVVVRVRVPPAAERLLSLPLEVARRGAKSDPLARAGVVAGVPGAQEDAVRDARVLEVTAELAPDQLALAVCEGWLGH